MEDRRKVEQPNSPQSVRDAVIYAVAAVVLVAAFFVMRLALSMVADDAAAAGAKRDITPVRSK